MAVRKKKDTTTGEESPKASKKRVSTKTTAEPRKRAAAPKKTRAEEVPPEVIDELQTVGADIVPSVALDVATSDMPVAAADAVIDHGTRSLVAEWDLHLFHEGTHHK